MIKERKSCTFKYLMSVASFLKMLDTPNKNIMPNKTYALRNTSSYISLFYLHSVFYKFSQNCPRLTRSMDFY